ncbi:antiviral protein MAP-like [Apium graveolens]|uniref:antiviral protein MAP-like n=1 Tax=Apium graveolens TaxID=4045 RepID=UPI003D79F01D
MNSSNLFVFLLSVCMMMMVMPSSPLVHDQEIDTILGYKNVTFELSNGASGYSSFLVRSRNVVEAPTRACGVRSTRNIPLPGAEYVYINLKISNTQWVTLGIDATTFYVWAYQDNIKYNGRFRASFLADAPQEATDKLFLGSTNRVTRFEGNYNDLEQAANVSRLNLRLGIQNLDGAIRAVYGRQEGQLNQGTAEAKFLLIAIQMVSEAARFKFMEDAIVRNDNTPNIKKKMVAFQNDWEKISNAIHKAEAKTLKCVRISPTLVISDIGYRQEVNTVAEIKNDLGLIKYYGNIV